MERDREKTAAYTPRREASGETDPVHTGNMGLQPLE